MSEESTIVLDPASLGPNVFWIRNVLTGERLMAVPALRDTMQVPIIYYVVFPGQWAQYMGARDTMQVPIIYYVVFPGQWAQYMGATILKEFFEVEEKCAVQSVEAEPPTIS
jgi:hypothetical protein